MGERRRIDRGPRARVREGGPELGALIEAFVNRVSHPRGRALAFLARSRVTVDQAILLSASLRASGSTPTTLAAEMGLSLPSVVQMIERLALVGLVRRGEDPRDGRRRTVEPTAKARSFLSRFRAVRVDEFRSATDALSERTRRELVDALGAALVELGPRRSDPHAPSEEPHR